MPSFTRSGRPRSSLRRSSASVTTSTAPAVSMLELLVDAVGHRSERYPAAGPGRG